VQITAQQVLGASIDHHLAGRLLQRWGVEAKPPTVAEAEAAVLRHLNEQSEWQRPAQIAVAVGCSQQYLNSILSRMAEAGVCEVRTLEEKVEKGRATSIRPWRVKLRIRRDSVSGVIASCEATSRLRSLRRTMAWPLLPGISSRKNSQS